MSESIPPRVYQKTKQRDIVRPLIFQELGITNESIRATIDRAINDLVQRRFDSVFTTNADPRTVAQNRLDKIVDNLIMKAEDDIRASAVVARTLLKEKFQVALEKEFAGLASDFIKTNIEFKARPKPGPQRPLILNDSQQLST